MSSGQEPELPPGQPLDVTVRIGIEGRLSALETKTDHLMEVNADSRLTKLETHLSYAKWIAGALLVIGAGLIVRTFADGAPSP